MTQTKAVKRNIDKKIENLLDFDYQDVKNLRRYNSKHEFEVARKVFARFEELLLARRTGCFWSQVPISPGVSLQDILLYNEGSSRQMGGTASNWNWHWNFMAKAYIMWHMYIDGKANVKSPLSWATIQAAAAEFQTNNQTVSLYPRSQKSSHQIMILQEYLRSLEIEGDFSMAKLDLFLSTAIYGTGIAYNPFVEKRHSKEIIIGGDKAQEYLASLKKGDEDAQKKYQYLKEQLEKNKPITKEIDIIEYLNPALVPISVFEFYPDNHASVLQGLQREATDCVHRKLRGVKDARLEYENSNDPYLIRNNISKIISATQTADIYGTGEKFFRIPADLQNTHGKCVEMHYYNKPEDLYVISINDTIIREGPLPYDHGQLPFSRYVIMPFDQQFYGISVVDQLENFQNADEQVLNGHIEAKKIATRPILIANDEIFEDIDEQYNRLEDGQIMRASGPIDDAHLRWFEGPASPAQEIVSFRQMLSDDVTKASGINDLAYSSSVPADSAVRNNMQAMESTYKFIKGWIKNWSYGYKESIKQDLANLRQKMPDVLTDEDQENEDEDRAFRTLLLKNVKLVENEDGEIEKFNTVGRYEFKLKPEYFQYSSDPEIEIDVDSLLPISQNMKIARSENALQQIIPLFMNPQAMANPLIVEFVKDYLVNHGYGSNILDMLQNDDRGEDDVKEAQKENEAMMKGQIVDGEGGRSPHHILVHYNLALDLKQKIQGFTFDDMNTPTKQEIDNYNKWVNIYNNILQHIDVDKLQPYNIGSDLQIMQTTTNASQPGQPPQGPQQGQGQPQPPMQLPPPGVGGPMPTMGTGGPPQPMGGNPMGPMSPAGPI